MVRVTHFVEVKPWRGPASTCPSDWDYYGYTEMDWFVCDRRGRPAPWLERKLTDNDRQRIEDEIAEAHRHDDCYYI